MSARKSLRLLMDVQTKMSEPTLTLPNVSLSPVLRHLKQARLAFTTTYLPFWLRHSPRPLLCSRPNVSLVFQVRADFLPSIVTLAYQIASDTTALSIAFGNQGQKLPLVRSLLTDSAECILTNWSSEIAMEQEVSAEDGINPVLKTNLTTTPKCDQPPWYHRRFHVQDLEALYSRFYKSSE
jgi:hypothetical protein